VTYPDRNRILVVDDDPATCTMVERVMRRELFQVDCARDGLEAIEKLTCQDYGTVLLDLMMPRVDGLGVLDFLEHKQPGSARRVIVMTANLDSLEQQQRTGAAFCVLDKPFDIRMLVAQVRECAEAASLTEGLREGGEGTVTVHSPPLSGN
jgi:DNA-binding response OmpR family regulator